MTERMADERLAEIGQLQITPESIADELLQALKAERQEVERLRDEAFGNGYAADGLGRLMDEWRERAEAAERKLERLVEGLEQQVRHCQDIANDLNLLKPSRAKQDIQSTADDLFRLCKEATGEGK